MEKLRLKIHRSNRWIVAICDSEIFGSKFSKDGFSLDLSTNFFNGEEIDTESARKKIRQGLAEDASFNIVGEKSIALALEEGIISKEGIKNICGIPVALVLL